MGPALRGRRMAGQARCSANGGPTQPSDGSVDLSPPAPAVGSTTTHRGAVVDFLTSGHEVMP